MKSKSKPEPSPENNSAKVVAVFEIQPGEMVPPGFEEFEGMNVKQIISALAPNVKNFAALAALLPGIELGAEVPHWARNAAQKFWETIGLKFSPGTEPLSPSVLGKLTGLIEANPTFKDERLNSERLQKFASEFKNMAKTEAANATPEVSKQFFDGRASHESIRDKVKGLAQRTKVFLVIAVAWQVVQTFKSAGELHRWLMKEKVVTSETDAAETRTICRLIELKFREKSGRPAKAK